jgi:hypothetical protein
MQNITAMACFKVLSQRLPQGNAYTSVRTDHTSEIRTQGVMNSKHEFYSLNLTVQFKCI